MEASVVTFILILIRVATFWFALPIFGQVNPPRTVKVGLAFALTLFWFASIEEYPEGIQTALENNFNLMSLIILAIREVVIGVLLGMCFNLFIMPLRIAGSYIAQELGLSLAALSDPSSPETSTVVSTLTQILGLLVFFLLDLHHLVIYVQHAVFERLPVASGFRFESTAGWAEGFAGVTGTGMEIIGPVSIILFVLLLAILFLAKAVPSLNLFSVGTSIRLIVGFLVLLVFMPGVLEKTVESFWATESYIEQLLTSMLNV